MEDPRLVFTIISEFRRAFYQISAWSTIIKQTHLPVFVMIISVPKSLNLSHSSFVSKWQIIGRNSSQLQVPTIFGLLYLLKDGIRKISLTTQSSLVTGSGVSRSSDGDGLGVVPRELFDVVLGVLDLDSASESLHCSTSTSNSSSPSVKRFIDSGPTFNSI